MTDRFAATDPQIDEAERIIASKLRHLALNPGWAEDDTAIGGQALNILAALVDIGWRPGQSQVVEPMDGEL